MPSSKNQQDANKRNQKESDCPLYLTNQICQANTPEHKQLHTILKQLINQPGSFHWINPSSQWRQTLVIPTNDLRLGAQEDEPDQLICLREHRDGFLDTIDVTMPIQQYLEGLTQGTFQAEIIRQWLNSDVRADDGFSLNPFGHSVTQTAESIAFCLFKIMRTLGLEVCNRQKRFIRQWEQTERSELGKALSGFTRGLAPNIMKLLNRAGQHDISVYNYYHAAGNAKLRIRRQQAATFYPLLTETFTQENTNGLSATIDAGLPLVPAIAKHYGVSKRTIKVLHGLHWQRAGARVRRTLPILIHWLDRLPRHAWPKSKEDWRVFNSNALFNLERLSNLTGAQLQCYTQLFQTGWAFPAEPFAAYKPLSRSLLLAHDALIDIGVSIVRSIVSRDESKFLPKEYVTWALPKSVQIILQFCFRHTSVQRLLAMGKLWQKKRGDIEDMARAKVTNKMDVCWQPMLTTPFHYKNHTMVALQSSAMLYAEGRALQHCIATHLRDCLVNGCQILSIRNAMGIPTSTVKFQLDDNGRFSLNGHHGRRNAEPTAFDRALLDRFLDDLEYGEVACDRDALLAFKRQKQGNATLLREKELKLSRAIAEGHDQAVLKQLRSFLPKQFRCTSIAKAIAGTPLEHDLLQEIAREQEQTPLVTQCGADVDRIPF